MPRATAAPRDGSRGHNSHITPPHAAQFTRQLNPQNNARIPPSTPCTHATPPTTMDELRTSTTTLTDTQLEELAAQDNSDVLEVKYDAVRVPLTHVQVLHLFLYSCSAFDSLAEGESHAALHPDVDHDVVRAFLREGESLDSLEAAHAAGTWKPTARPPPEASDADLCSALQHTNGAVDEFVQRHPRSSVNILRAWHPGVTCSKGEFRLIVDRYREIQLAYIRTAVGIEEKAQAEAAAKGQPPLTDDQLRALDFKPAQQAIQRAALMESILYEGEGEEQGDSGGAAQDSQLTAQQRKALKERSKTSLATLARDAGVPVAIPEPGKTTVFGAEDASTPIGKPITAEAASRMSEAAPHAVQDSKLQAAVQASSTARAAVDDGLDHLAHNVRVDATGIAHAAHMACYTAESF